MLCSEHHVFAGFGNARMVQDSFSIRKQDGAASGGWVVEIDADNEKARCGQGI